MKRYLKILTALDASRSSNDEENDRQESRVHVAVQDQDTDTPQLFRCADKVTEMEDASVTMAGDSYPLLFRQRLQHPV